MTGTMLVCVCLLITCGLLQYQISRNKKRIDDFEDRMKRAERRAPSVEESKPSHVPDSRQESASRIRPAS